MMVPKLVFYTNFDNIFPSDNVIFIKLLCILMGTNCTCSYRTEITQRVSAAWRNWKRCSGVLCDRRMPVKLKGTVYKTVVRPALLYGAETWATTRGQEARIEVNEMRMLRWVCGVTRGIKSEMNT